VNLDTFIEAIQNEQFEERPVDLETFLYDENFLGMPPLSEHQITLLEAMTQIFRYETLVELWGQDEADRLWKSTQQEIIFCLGKGCHAPHTPVYNPASGNWERLDGRVSDGVVLSDDGEVHYATEAFMEGRGEMVRVRTSMGLEEEVYIGHKYLSVKKSEFYKRESRGMSPKYTRIDELSPGDRIAVALGFDVESPQNIPVEHAELIGYWLGDGCMPADHNPTLNVDFCADEHESIARYEYLCEYIGDTPRKKVYSDKNMVSFVHGSNSNANKIVAEYGLWGSRAGDKKIPHQVWKSDNTILAACVSRLWQADGCVYDKRNTRRGTSQVTAEFCSISHELAVDVHRALMRLGVPSTIRLRTPKSNFNNASEAGYVTVTSYENMSRFKDVFSMLDHKQVPELIGGRRAWKRQSGNLYYDKIVSIESIGEGEYWTLTVPDTGNYVGGGMVSANSGKDMVTSIGFARVAYLLLCLKDPAKYYGKPPGDSIALLNVAINAKQAKNVFFRYFRQRIKLCPWFDGKWEATQDSIRFDKNVEAHSGHSEREAWEGYNFLVVTLDEIAGFATDAESTADGGSREKTADAIYDMYKASVSSRFPKYGKLVLLSFPRYEGDFIDKRYNEVIAEKNVIQREHKFKIHDDLPDGVEDNEFTIYWDEDHIVSYKEDGVFALRRPTWDVNPILSIEDFKSNFLNKLDDSMGRFACLDENELVWTNKGLIPIKDVRPGDLVNSRHGPTRVTHAWSQEKQCIEIEFKNGQKIVCTPDHGLLEVLRVRTGKGRDGKTLADRLGKYAVEWNEAANVKSVLGHYSSDVFGNNKLSEQEAYLLGLILADGWIRNDDRKYVGIACGADESFARDVAELFEQTFGPCQVVSRVPDPELSKKNQWSVHATKYDVVQKVYNLGLRRVPAQEKTVPNVIFGAPESAILAFLSGFADGDGSINEQGNLTYVSTSKTLLEQIANLAAGVGARSNLGVNTRAVSSRGKIQSRFDLWGLRFNKYDSTVLSKKLNLMSRKGYRFVPKPFKARGQGVHQKLNNDVVAVRPVGTRRVVDITTENHEFVAQGLVVHNCMPPKAIDAFFRDRSVLERAFPDDTPGPFRDDWSWREEFKPDRERNYYIHVDLGYKHDRAAVAMASVERWATVNYGSGVEMVQPIIRLDCVRYWTPTRDQNVDLEEVQNFVVTLKQAGFPIKLVTFDRWQSVGYRQRLKSDWGISTDLLSVAKPHYEDFSLALHDKRVLGYSIPLLVDELIGLQVIKNNRVDHPRKGSKDISDAVAGAVYNAIANEKSPGLPEIEIFMGAPGDEDKPKKTEQVHVPKQYRKMPSDIANYLESIQLI
jgi:intein/homing endonuclease